LVTEATDDEKPRSVFPVPNWPATLLPQHFTTPPEMTEQKKSQPAARSLAPASPATVTGFSE
jgi:hypothetical protein